MKDSETTLPDGRQLAYTDIGDPAGAVVMFIHGAPTSRLSLVPQEQDFARRGLRVISADRPGYGGSSPRPGRTIADVTKDMSRLADELAIDRFTVAGYSSGGPYAAACAALLPEKVNGAVILAGVTDFSWPRAMDGYTSIEGQLMRLPDEQSVADRCLELFGADGSGLLRASGMELPAPDMALFSDSARVQAIGVNVREAFRQGVVGYAQDIFVQSLPWPFDPAGITAPVTVAHGELDTIVPVAHGRHTAELIPGSSLQIMPGHGHLTVIYELPDILVDLQSRN